MNAFMLSGAGLATPIASDAAEPMKEVFGYKVPMKDFLASKAFFEGLASKAAKTKTVITLSDYKMTPADAAYLMSVNKTRSPRMADVYANARKMVAGEWHPSPGTPISYSDACCCINGLHRCGGVLHSGLPFVIMTVVIGVPHADGAIIDTGRGRTESHIAVYMGLAGDPLLKYKAQCIRIVYGYRINRGKGTRIPTLDKMQKDEVMTLVAKNNSYLDDLIDGINKSIANTKDQDFCRDLDLGIMMAVLHIVRRDRDSTLDQALTFVGRLYDGSLTTNTAINRCRKGITTKSYASRLSNNADGLTDAKLRYILYHWMRFSSGEAVKKTLALSETRWIDFGYMDTLLEDDADEDFDFSPHNPVSDAADDDTEV